jgi:hypothetical protein
MKNNKLRILTTLAQRGAKDAISTLFCLRTNRSQNATLNGGRYGDDVGGRVPKTFRQAGNVR